MKPYHCPRCERQGVYGLDAHKHDFLHAENVLQWKYDIYCTCNFCVNYTNGFATLVHSSILTLACVYSGVDLVLSPPYSFFLVKDCVQSPSFTILTNSAMYAGIVGFDKAMDWLRGVK